MNGPLNIGHEFAEWDAVPSLPFLDLRSSLSLDVPIQERMVDATLVTFKPEMALGIDGPQTTSMAHVPSASAHRSTAEKVYVKSLEVARRTVMPTRRAADATPKTPMLKIAATPTLRSVVICSFHITFWGTTKMKISVIRLTIADPKFVHAVSMRQLPGSNLFQAYSNGVHDAHTRIIISA